MEEIITQVGVPAIVVILILREVIPVIKNGKVKNNSCINREEFNSHKQSVQYKDNCEQIVKRIDGRFDTVDSNLKEVKDMLRER